MAIQTYDVSMKAKPNAQALVFAALCTIFEVCGNRVALRPRFHAYVTSVYLQAWPRICLLDDRQQIQQVVGAGSESWTVGFRVQRTDHSGHASSRQGTIDYHRLASKRFLCPSLVFSWCPSSKRVSVLENEHIY